MAANIAVLTIFSFCYIWFQEILYNHKNKNTLKFWCICGIQFNTVIIISYFFFALEEKIKISSEMGGTNSIENFTNLSSLKINLIYLL